MRHVPDTRVYLAKHVAGILGAIWLQLSSGAACSAEIPQAAEETSVRSGPFQATAPLEEHCPQGRHWTRVPTGEEFDLVAVYSTGETVAAHGAAGSIIEYRDGVWTRTGTMSAPVRNEKMTDVHLAVPVPFEARGIAKAVAQGREELLAVGTKGKIALLSNGAWRLMDSGSSTDLLAVYAGSRPYDWVAVGARGTALHYTCGALPSGPDPPRCIDRYDVTRVAGKLLAAAGESHSNYYLAGTRGLWHVVQGSARPLWDDTLARIEALVMADGELIGVGTHYAERRALVLRCRSNVCKPDLLAEKGVLKDLIRLQGGQLLAVGQDFSSDHGLLIRLDRSVGKWKRDATFPRFMPEVVATGSAEGELWVAGRDLDTHTIGLAYQYSHGVWTKRFARNGAPLWDLTPHGNAIWIAGGAAEKSAEFTGVLAMSRPAEWYDVPINNIALRAIGVAADDRILASVLRKLPGARVRSELVEIELSNGSQTSSCALPGRFDGLSKLQDGSFIAVGESGWALAIPAPSR